MARVIRSSRVSPRKRSRCMTCSSLRNPCSIFVFSAKIQLAEVSSGEWLNVRVKDLRLRWHCVDWKLLASGTRKRTERGIIASHSWLQLTTSTFNRAPRLASRLRVVDGYARHVTARRGSYFTRARDCARRSDFLQILSSRNGKRERKKKRREGERERTFFFNLNQRLYISLRVNSVLTANLDDAHDSLKIVQTRRGAIFLVFQLSKSPFLWNEVLFEKKFLPKKRLRHFWLMNR